MIYAFELDAIDCMNYPLALIEAGGIAQNHCLWEAIPNIRQWYGYPGWRSVAQPLN
jgi:hypothetical protein